MIISHISKIPIPESVYNKHPHIRIVSNLPPGHLARAPFKFIMKGQDTCNPNKPKTQYAPAKDRFPLLAKVDFVIQRGSTVREQEIV